MAAFNETVDIGKYFISSHRKNEYWVCYDHIRPPTNNFWQMKDPTHQYLPIFMFQLGLFILFMRVLLLLLKPLRLSRFSIELLAGFIFSPSLLGKLVGTSHNITPYEGIYLLQTASNIGVTFYMFLVGLEMNLTPFRRIGKAALSVAIAGIVLPICSGAGLHYLVLKMRGRTLPFGGIFFWAIALSVTSFPDLVRTLSNLKLISTDLGKTALTAAAVSDLSSWSLLVAAVSLINVHLNWKVATAILGCMTVFWLMIRRLIFRILEWTEARKESSKEDKYSDKHVYVVLSVVLIFGCLTEICGAHSMFGAFMFGLMMPRGELRTMVMEKTEDFIVGILLPPTFLLAGMRTNLPLLFSELNLGWVLLVILAACSAKIVSTLLVCFCLKCPMRDSLALGFLMNTKGVSALIAINEARSMKVIDGQSFTLVMLAIFAMSSIVVPVVGFTHKSARHVKHYYSNLVKSRPELGLRVLACLHSTKNLSGLINLLHLSNASRKSPITLFAVHLVELAGRATAMVIFHDKNHSDDVGDKASREESEAEQIMNALESFEKDCHAATVQALTAVSPYATMHEDIDNFARDKSANIILIPFHKQPNALGGWADENVQHRQVNQNLLANASCSVGLLVDRGLTSPLFSEAKPGKGMRVCQVAMLFVEGADDREALAYALRMVGTARLTLTVVRFLPGKEASELIESVRQDEESGIFTAMLEQEKEKQLDDDYVNEFRFKTMHEKSVVYMEKQVNSGDQIVSMINSSLNNFNLYIVGRGHGRKSVLTSGLSDWSDCAELGPLGETLVSKDWESAAGSVLVVQQAASQFSSKDLDCRF